LRRGRGGGRGGGRRGGGRVGGRISSGSRYIGTSYYGNGRSTSSGSSFRGYYPSALPVPPPIIIQAPAPPPDDRYYGGASYRREETSRYAPRDRDDRYDSRGYSSRDDSNKRKYSSGVEYLPPPSSAYSTPVVYSSSSGYYPHRY